MVFDNVVILQTMILALVMLVVLVVLLRVNSMLMKNTMYALLGIREIGEDVKKFRASYESSKTRVETRSIPVSLYKPSNEILDLERIRREVIKESSAQVVVPVEPQIYLNPDNYKEEV